MNSIINFFKGLYNSSRIARRRDSLNPWAGLSSYEDPEKTDRPLRFCGRSEDTKRILGLIDENIILTLYGKSGIGKTSLLNAGVFPLLREKNYFPIYLRLGVNVKVDEISASVLDEVESSIKYRFGDDSVRCIDVVAETEDSWSNDYMWSYFARHKFYNQNGEAIFPVIVFDQFEEFIRSNKEATVSLLKQMAFMADRNNAIRDCMVDGMEFCYDYNFRFILSIREDDFYHLEDVVNLHYLSSLKNCRYRLHNLSNIDAREIVMSNGQECLDQSSIYEISDAIIEASKKNSDGLISTNALSLICSRIYDLSREQGKSMITRNDVVEYLKKDPFEEYYSDAVRNLSEREKNYIEQNLITSDGRRNVVKESHLKDSIRSTMNLFNGPTRILHLIPSEDQDENNVELLHDGICSIVEKHRSLRLEKKTRTVYGLILLFVGLVSIWILNHSVVNDFVYFFLTVTNKGINSLTLVQVLSVSQIISILCFPIAISTLVFDSIIKKRVACVIGCVYFLPFSLFPKSVYHCIVKLATDFQELSVVGKGIKIITGMDGRVESFVVYSVVVVVLILLALFQRKGIRTSKNGLSELLISRYTLLFYLIISLFLFYKSIFNTGHFIVEQQDSSWGVIVIPLLTLLLTDHDVFCRNKRTVGIVYIVILVILGCIAWNNIPIPLNIIWIITGFSFILLLGCFYNRGIIRALGISFVNVFALLVVLLTNIGYNPNKITSHTIYRVYPWKIVIFEQDGCYGVLDAQRGDTLLTPVFSSYEKLILKKDLSAQTELLDSLSMSQVFSVESLLSFPLKVLKKNGMWSLEVQIVPGFDQAVAGMCKFDTKKDSTLKANKLAASLYFGIRNNIISFYETGNEEYLLSHINEIKEYEHVVKSSLDTSLATLMTKANLMTEEEIAPFLRDLTRSIYLNILKESALRGHSNTFTFLFPLYYVPIDLTSVAHNYMKWDSTTNLSWFFESNGTDSVSNKSQQFEMRESLDALNDNLIYAWNNLFITLCNISISTNAQGFYQNQNEKGKQQYEFFKNLYEKVYNIGDKSAKVSDALNVLKSQAENLEKKEEFDIIETLTAYQDCINYFAEMKCKLTNTKEQLSDFNKSLIDLELLESDREFEIVATSTLEKLLSVIEKNPVNAYNGMLISNCQYLYSIGVYRGYNMTKYVKYMDKLQKYEAVPLYKMLRENEKNQEMMKEKLDSVLLVNTKSLNLMDQQLIRRGIDDVR